MRGDARRFRRRSGVQRRTVWRQLPWRRSPLCRWPLKVAAGRSLVSMMASGGRTDTGAGAGAGAARRVLFRGGTTCAPEFAAGLSTAVEAIEQAVRSLRCQACRRRTWRVCWRCAMNSLGAITGARHDALVGRRARSRLRKADRPTRARHDARPAERERERIALAQGHGLSRRAVLLFVASRMQWTSVPKNSLIQ